MKTILKQSKIIAIMRNIPLDLVVEYSRVCVEGGITALEVALNSKNALEEIELLKKNFGSNIFVGAGTALTVDLAKSAVAAGADFLLSPSVSCEVLDFCAENKIKLLPGVFTPSDVAACYVRNFKYMKLFPASEMPLSYIKSLKGPFDGAEFVAVGGVNEKNIVQYLSAGYAGVGLGGGLFDKQLLLQGDAGRREAVENVKRIVALAE